MMDEIAANDGISRRAVMGVLSAIGIVGACNGRGDSRERNAVSLSDFADEKDIDYSAALQRAIAAGNGSVHIPQGVYIIDRVTGSDVHLYGEGTLRKKPGTKGVMLYLAGKNRIEGITIDYDWPNAEASAPFVNNIALYQRQGELHLIGVTCRRSFFAAVYVEGGSLNTDANCSFTEAIAHNGLRGKAARLSHYIICVSDRETRDQAIIISGGKFVGSSLEKESLHRNPTGVFITPSKLDGNRFRSINITNATFIGCSTNCGDGNVTGAIDIYNGAENITISGLTIRLFTYAAIKVENSSKFNIFGNVVSEGFVPRDAYLKASCGCVTTQKVRGSTGTQSAGQIWNNVLTGMCYAAIINSCDFVIIANNVIDGVKYNKLGNAVENSGNDVQILNNVATNIEGYQVNNSGERCRVEGNDMDSGTTAARGGATFTGTGTTIRRNRFRSGVLSGGSGIRTDGPASNFEISDNVIEGFPYGVDIRATAGVVDKGVVGENSFIGNGTPVNISPATSAIRISSL